MDLSTFSVINPSGLWALGILAIPILIHLFNRSKGRLVRIGNIDLIRKARQLRVTEIKLAQWLLLFLRLGIFLLAALLLARLALPGFDTVKVKSSYVTPAWIKTATQDDLNTLITPGADGQRVLILQAGFDSLTEATASLIKQSPASAEDIINVWPLLAEQLSLARHTGEVHVYVTDYFQQFGTERTALPRQVNWHISHPKTAPTTGKHSIFVELAYDPEHAEDARYIQAALSSLKAHRLPALEWHIVELANIGQKADGQTDVGQENAGQASSNWLIVLSGKAFNRKQLDQTDRPVTILLDGIDSLQNQKHYVSLPFYPYSSFTVRQAASAFDDSETDLLVASNSGWPAIQESQSGNTRIVQFNSRFNPRFSSIAELAEFPGLLLQLMLTDQQRIQAYTGARISQHRLSTEFRSGPTTTPQPFRSLTPLLMMLLILLWVTERWLSERGRREAL